MIKRSRCYMLILLTWLFVICGCKPDTHQSGQNTVMEKPGIAAESRKLAVVSPEYIALSQDKARPQGVHDELIVVAKDGSGVAYIERVRSQYRVVHNGKAGRSYQLVGDLTISNDGKHVAYTAHLNDTFKSIILDGIQGPLFTDIGMPKFSPDSQHLVYTITQGKEERLVIDQKVNLEFHVSQDLLISPDSRFIAFAVKPAKGGIEYMISDFALKDKKIYESCGESVVASEDESRIAVLCSDGKSRTFKILDLPGRSPVSTLDVADAGAIVNKKFAGDNQTLIYTTITDDLQRFIHFKGRSEKIPSGDEIMSSPVSLSNSEGVGVIIGNAFKVHFYAAFQKSSHKEKYYGYISDLVSNRDGNNHAYVAIDPGGEERMRIVINGNEGPLYDKIVSPMFSPDGKLLVYRARQGGKRFLVISDMMGAVVRQHKEYDMVFQPVFTQDGKSVAYAVLDGSEFWWKVEKL